MNKEEEYLEKIKELEKKIRCLSARDEICDWISCSGKRCKKQSFSIYKDYKFCKLHKNMIKEYTIDEDTEELCESFMDVKIIPRSYKQIKYFMKEIDNEETTVKVLFPGGCTEEADISENEYISLLSDDSKYYYKHERGYLKAKDLKLLLRKYCKNNGIIDINNIKYCEECHNKNKNSPRLDIIQ
jgi:hypothetical protein